MSFLGYTSAWHPLSYVGEGGGKPKWQHPSNSTNDNTPYIKPIGLAPTLLSPGGRGQAGVATPQ